MSRKSRSFEAYQSRICRKKIVYETIEEATLASFKRYRDHRRYMVPYTCPVCGKMHLTTKDGHAIMRPIIAAAMVMAHVKTNNHGGGNG